MRAPASWQDVPAALAPALAPAIPALTDEIITAVRAEVPEYDQPLEGEFGRLISGGVRFALRQFIDLLGTADQPSTAAFEELGSAELEAGRTLDALQSAYRTGARVSWRRIVTGADPGVDPQLMYRLAEAIFAYIDRLADASVAGYTNALALREGSAQARRQALVEALIAGSTPPDELEALARRAAWPLPRALRVLACDHDDPEALARRLPDGTIAARSDDGARLVVPDPDGPGRRSALEAALTEVAGAIGPAVPVARAPESAARAAQGLALVRTGALRRDAPVWTDEHRLDLLLAADPDIAGELVAAHLGPLAQLTPKARARAHDTLRAWLDAHGDVSVAADALHVHAQTVRYRLGTLRDLLGDGVFDDPRQRLELTLALAARAQAT